MYFIPRQSRMSYHVRGVTALPTGEEQHYQQHFTAKYFFVNTVYDFVYIFLYCNLYNKITICIFTVQVNKNWLSLFNMPLSCGERMRPDTQLFFKNTLVDNLLLNIVATILAGGAAVA